MLGFDATLVSAFAIPAVVALLYALVVVTAALTAIVTRNAARRKAALTVLRILTSRPSK
jgi:hypothetical protein